MLRNDPEVTFDHVREMFGPCIEHRLQVRPGANPASVIEELVATVAAPGQGPALGLAA
jgi:hypothetical protein